MASSTDDKTPPVAAAETNQHSSFVKAGVVLRLLLFVATLVALVLTTTSKQTKLVMTPFLPVPLSLTAKFTDSPAVIYFVAASAVTCFYSIVTAIVAAFYTSKETPAATTFLLLILPSTDALLSGIMASATGALAAVAYIGLKGNSHVQWRKVCDTFDTFCKHVGTAAAFSLLASIILVLLVVTPRSKRSKNNAYLLSQGRPAEHQNVIALGFPDQISSPNSKP